MKRTSKQVLIALGFLVGGIAGASSVFAAGTSGGLILDMPASARAIAMGEAYTALTDDASSLYWNPAGLALQNQSNASFMYNQAIEGLSYQNAAVATPLENGGIGGSLSYLSYGNINGFDTHGNATSDVTAYSGVGTLGGGLLLGPLSVGINAKAVRSQLADVSATGAAADFGAIWTVQREIYGGTLRWGATLRNVGTGLKFIDERDSFPMQWRFGAALVEMLDKKLNASVDVGKEDDVRPGYYGGLEYWLVPMLAVRAGFTGTNQEGNGIRAGLGLKVKDFSFDYAYSAYGDLGMSHRYEVSWRFGVIHQILTKEERALLRRAQVAMAEGHYGEAVMLFDSLATMAPDYRPVHRYLKVAMRDFEGQEAAQDAVGSVVLKGLDAGDRSLDVDELSDLLQQGDDAEKMAAAKEEEALKAEESTLAPLVPANPSGATQP